LSIHKFELDWETPTGKGNPIRTALTAVVVLALALPASAHDRSYLDEWVADWFTKADVGLSVALMDEYQDMRERHPHYFNPQPSSSSSVSRSMGSNVEQWRGLVSVYFPADQVDRALCLMSYESGGNPNAKNPRSTARGLMQVLASLWAPAFGVSYEDLYDPETNLRIASEIYRSQGWRAWSPYNRGLCH